MTWNPGYFAINQFNVAQDGDVSVPFFLYTFEILNNERKFRFYVVRCWKIRQAITSFRVPYIEHTQRENQWKHTTRGTASVSK